jgi:hypothetical protein
MAKSWGCHLGNRCKLGELGKLVWSDLSASTEKQAEDVLKFIESQ